LKYNGSHGSSIVEAGAAVRPVLYLYRVAVINELRVTLYWTASPLTTASWHSCCCCCCCYETPVLTCQSQLALSTSSTNRLTHARHCYICINADENMRDKHRKDTT